MTFLTELACELETSDEKDEETPANRVFHVLHVDDAKHEDDFVEHQVPKLFLHVVLLGCSQDAKDPPLHRVAQQNQQTVAHVQQRLKIKQDVISIKRHISI